MSFQTPLSIKQVLDRIEQHAYVLPSIQREFVWSTDGRLNKLYVELLRHNPDWSTDARREAMNHFMARLIFCYFAEDTGIFHDGSPFTQTVQQMSAPDGSNTHEVVAECFRSMDTRGEDREAAGIKPFARGFPYVNGGLFGGGCTPDDVPRFSKIAYIGRRFKNDTERLEHLFDPYTKMTAKDGRKSKGSKA